MLVNSKIQEVWKNCFEIMLSRLTSLYICTIQETPHIALKTDYSILYVQTFQHFGPVGALRALAGKWLGNFIGQNFPD